MAPTPSAPGRWWSWWLVAHTAAVAALLVGYGADWPVIGRSLTSHVATGIDGTASLLLSSPWWLVLGPLWDVTGSSSDGALLAVVGWVEQALPLVLNLVLHAVLLRAARRRRAARTAGALGAAPWAHDGGSGTAGPRRGRWLGLSAVGGAAVWATWLGWDRSPSYDVVTHTVQDPYVTLQVLGCAACVGLLIGVLAALGRPLEGAGGVALGFWLVWSVDALSQDGDGLAAVGAVFLAFGLALGGTVTASIGWGLRRLVVARRAQHVL